VENSEYETWFQAYSQMASCQFVKVTELPITDDGTQIPSTIEVTNSHCGHIESLQHIEVYVSTDHEYRGDLRVELVSPSGISSVLSHARPEAGRVFSEWKFMTVRSWGEQPEGEWTLKVSDQRTGHVGRWRHWRMVLHGSCNVDYTLGFTNKITASSCHAKHELAEEGSCQYVKVMRDGREDVFSKQLGLYYDKPVYKSVTSDDVLYALRMVPLRATNGAVHFQTNDWCIGTGHIDCTEYSNIQCDLRVQDLAFYPQHIRHEWRARDSTSGDYSAAGSVGIQCTAAPPTPPPTAPIPTPEPTAEPTPEPSLEPTKAPTSAPSPPPTFEPVYVCGAGVSGVNGRYERQGSWHGSGDFYHGSYNLWKYTSPLSGKSWWVVTDVVVSTAQHSHWLSEKEDHQALTQKQTRWFYESGYESGETPMTQSTEWRALADGTHPAPTISLQPCHQFWLCFGSNGDPQVNGMGGLYRTNGMHDGVYSFINDNGVELWRYTDKSAGKSWWMITKTLTLPTVASVPFIRYFASNYVDPSIDIPPLFTQDWLILPGAAQSGIHRLPLLSTDSCSSIEAESAMLKGGRDAAGSAGLSVLRSWNAKKVIKEVDDFHPRPVEDIASPFKL